jgi:hypothetical protein
MLPEVEQHVHHARSHLPRRRERTGVVAIADDLPLAAEDAIDGERQPDGEPVHAATGTARLIPLDDEVPVSCWMEKWITRNRSTDARPMARRSAPNTRADLSDGSPGAARIVTCSGYRGSTFARVSCGIEGRPRRFRPAPFRSPPHFLATSSGNRSCRLRPDLIPRMFHLSARTAWGCVAPTDLIPRMLRPGAACRDHRWSSLGDHDGTDAPG